MKEGIHPEYKTVKVTCSCGNAFETRSATTRELLQLDVCSNCHPFYTGKQKMVDTGGRVEKFKNKYAAKPVPVKAQAAETTTKAAGKKESKSTSTKSAKEKKSKS